MINVNIVELFQDFFVKKFWSFMKNFDSVFYSFFDFIVSVLLIWMIKSSFNKLKFIFNLVKRWRVCLKWVFRILKKIVLKQCVRRSRWKMVFKVLNFLKPIEEWWLFWWGSFFDFFNSFDFSKRNMFSSSFNESFL